MALDRQHWMVTVALVTSSLIAFVVNLLLLLVFYKRRGLRTISNRFTINLLFINLLSSILLIPLLIVEQHHSKSASGNLSNGEAIFVKNVTSSGEIIIREKELRGDEILHENTLERFLGRGATQFPFAKPKMKSRRSDRDEADFAELTIFRDDLVTTKESQGVSGVLCYIAQSTVGLICTASILSVLLIGVDQYLAVIHSLRYYSYIDKFRSSVLIAGSWLISLLFAVFGAATQSDSAVWQFCALARKDNGSLGSIYAIIYFALIILTPLAAICAIYARICAAARNNSERMRQQKTTTQQHPRQKKSNNSYYSKISAGTSESRLDLKVSSQDGEEDDEDEEGENQKEAVKKGLLKVHSAPNFLNLVNTADCERQKQRQGQEQEEQQQREAKRHPSVKRTCSERTPGFISNLRYKISNASSAVFRYREETRAAKVSSLVIFMVLVCYLPYGFAVLLNSQLVSVRISPTFNFISLILLVFANILSPFLFAYRNRRIRRELLKVFGLIPPSSSSSSNRSLRHVTKRRSNSVLPAAADVALSLQQHGMIREETRRENVPTPKYAIPQVIVTCKVENERPEKSQGILKRVCSGKNWQSYSKKCSFIAVPESCWQADSTRGSFSSASTQSSVED